MPVRLRPSAPALLAGNGLFHGKSPWATLDCHPKDGNSTWGLHLLGLGGFSPPILVDFWPMVSLTPGLRPGRPRLVD